jgi:uncharacterized linocin/CFP29 family protein
MADSSASPGWSAAQWDIVNSAITDSFGKASVAAMFLPCYGPLPASAEYVRDEQLSVATPSVSIQDDRTLKLFNLTVKVALSNEQVAEESLSSALLAFRRAANILGQVEDDIVFNGYSSSKAAAAAGGPAKPAQAQQPQKDFASVVASGPESIEGLADHSKRRQEILRPSKRTTGKPSQGNSVVKAVVRAIGTLEDAAHSGPFACVLGKKAFEDAHTPTDSMVLPADRITPMLKGPLLRSGRLDPNVVLVVALGASAIDIVVATPPKAQFLQMTEDAKYLFRVYERFILRIKDLIEPPMVSFKVESSY